MSVIRFIDGPVDGQIRGWPDPLPHRIYFPVRHPIDYSAFRRGDPQPDYLPWTQIAYERDSAPGWWPWRAYRFVG